MSMSTGSEEGIMRMKPWLTATLLVALLLSLSLNIVLASSLKRGSLEELRLRTTADVLRNKLESQTQVLENMTVYIQGGCTGRYQGVR
jgi:hypothetical protein